MHYNSNNSGRAAAHPATEYLRSVVKICPEVIKFRLPVALQVLGRAVRSDGVSQYARGEAVVRHCASLFAVLHTCIARSVGQAH